mgnify:CR=1 FL=1
MYIVVLVTAKDKKEAQIIAAGLIKKKLAACVNIVDGINCHFVKVNTIHALQDDQYYINHIEKIINQ